MRRLKSRFSSVSPQTDVYQVDPETPDTNVIQLAAEAIRAGKLVAFPTETVYGLGATALDASAVARIFDAKQRPATDPIIAHIADSGTLYDLTIDAPAIVKQLTDAFWPGPLTLVLQRAEHIPANLSAGMPTIAVRMPTHPVAFALIKTAGVPIAAPSANLFSRPSATTAEHVLADLNGRIDMILDAGPTSIGVESTVLDMTQTPPIVLRPGGTAITALQQFLPDVQQQQRWHTPEQAGTSPGMMTKHYSPRAEVKLYRGALQAVLNAINTYITDADESQEVGVLLPEVDLRQIDVEGSYAVSLGKTAEDAASRLFAGLRSLDELGVEVILTREPTFEGPLNTALVDRLQRAAEGRVTSVVT